MNVMLRDLPALECMVDQLRRLPYLASKNVYRVAAHFLSCEGEEVERFCQAVLEARRSVKPCIECFNWTQGDERCSVCSDSARGCDVICVVETWHDLVSIERSGDFRGLYHVLGGALCPIDGIGPEKLRIDPLIRRVKNGGVSELIFATNPTPEGEATASFIASKLKGLSLRVTRLASGIPIGSTLEFIDRMTIHKALVGRQLF